MTIADVLQADIDAAGSAGGGIVIVPPGRHEISAYRGLEMRSGVELRGAPGSLLVRSGTCASVIYGERVERVRFSGLRIEIARTKNFQTAIGLLDCTDVLVADCDLRSTELAPVGETIHAVLAQRTSRLEVRDTYVRGAQLKVAGAGGGTRIAVRRCRADDARNCGVSAVLMYDADVLEDVTIEDVVVSGYGNAGIFVGSDNGYEAAGAIHGLVVRRCRVRGPTEGSSSCGLLARLGRNCSDWEFSDIRIAPTWTTPLQTAMGFALLSADTGAPRLTDLRIRDVRQIGRAYVGVELRGGVDRLELRDVHAVSRVRFLAHAGPLTGIRVRDVRGDIERAGAHPIVMEVYAP